MTSVFGNTNNADPTINSALCKKTRNHEIPKNVLRLYGKYTRVMRTINKITSLNMSLLYQKTPRAEGFLKTLFLIF